MSYLRLGIRAAYDKALGLPSTVEALYVFGTLRRPRQMWSNRSMIRSLASQVDDLALAARVVARRTGGNVVDVAEEILDRGETRFAELAAALDADRVSWSTVCRRIRGSL